MKMFIILGGQYGDSEAVAECHGVFETFFEARARLKELFMDLSGIDDGYEMNKTKDGFSNVDDGYGVVHKICEFEVGKSEKESVTIYT